MERKWGGSYAPLNAWLKGGIIGGLAGGVAEIAFMGLYCLATGKSGASILSLITFTFTDRGFAFGPLGGYSGVLIHLALSVLIGISFGIAFFLVNGSRGRGLATGPVLPAAALLTAIWAFNFFILLPRISPEFVATVPARAAFFSKLLFGLSLGVSIRLVAGTVALKGRSRGHVSFGGGKERFRYVNE